MIYKSFLIFTMCLMQTISSNASIERTVEDFYEQGVQLRKAKAYKQARSSFNAVLFSDNIELRMKALYNLGSISYKEEKFDEAHTWFSRSNVEHLKVHGAEYGPALRSLNLVSQNKPRLDNTREALFAPNYCLEDFFQSVTFDHAPESISLKQAFIVENGDLEIHFRDADHLRKIARTTPLFQAESIYYIENSLVENGQEFQAVGGCGAYVKFMDVTGENPLNPRGRIDYMPFIFHVPQGSILNNLDYMGNNYSKGSLPSHKALRLANHLINITNDSITQQFSRALTLLNERRSDRQEHPENYPSFNQLTPEKYCLTDSDIICRALDHIASKTMPFYVASTKEALLKVKANAPFFEEPLFFIKPILDAVGLYSENPLYLKESFQLHCLGNLLLSGKMILPGYNFEIKSDKSMWLIACNMKAKVIRVISDGSLTSTVIRYPIERMQRPSELPLNLWNAFRRSPPPRSFFRRERKVSE